MVTVTNGHDAVDEFEKNSDIDIIFLDESMPGLSGLQTMQRLKAIKPSLPIVMITKGMHPEEARLTALPDRVAAGHHADLVVCMCHGINPKTRESFDCLGDAEGEGRPAWNPIEYLSDFDSRFVAPTGPPVPSTAPLLNPLGEQGQ